MNQLHVYRFLLFYLNRGVDLVTMRQYLYLLFSSYSQSESNIANEIWRQNRRKVNADQRTVGSRLLSSLLNCICLCILKPTQFDFQSFKVPLFLNFYLYHVCSPEHLSFRTRTRFMLSGDRNLAQDFTGDVATSRLVMFFFSLVTQMERFLQMWFELFSFRDIKLLLQEARLFVGLVQCLPTSFVQFLRELSSCA